MKLNRRKFCECGCGNSVRASRRFVCGHNPSGPKKGTRFSEEHKKNISLAKKGKPSPKLGNKLSEEHKRKISKSLKGLIPWNKGKHQSKETKEKISKANKGNLGYWKGKHLSKEIKKKISETRLNRYKGVNSSFWGRTHSVETRKKISEGNKGKMITEDTKRKMSKAHRGKPGSMLGKKHSEETRKKISSKSVLRCGPLSPNWKGGISLEPYCCIFSLKEFKEIILERDNYQCQNSSCKNNSKRFCVHHIDYDKKNCKLNNLITLCTSCNARANYNREYWGNVYYQDVAMGGVTHG